MNIVNNDYTKDEYGGGLEYLVNNIHWMHEELKHQGIRSDLRNTKSYRVNEIIGKKLDLSSRTVSRYLRLYDLDPELQELVYGDKISLRTAVELSYLSKDVQKLVAECSKTKSICIKYMNVVVLRQLEKCNVCNTNIIEEVLNNQIASTFNRTKENLIIKYKLYDMSEEEIMRLLNNLLAKHYENNVYKVKW